MMARNILITRPKHDIPTSYLHDFSKDIVEKAKNDTDIHITNLEGAEAIRKNVERALRNEKPGLVFLNGHGDKKRVAGYKDKIILDYNNIHLTKDMIVYALACDSLEGLGRKSIKTGTSAYIGYGAKFMIVRDPSREGIPHKDKNAIPFKKACSVMISSLVYGSTVKQAIEKTKNEYIHQIRYFGTSEDDPYGDTPLIRFALAWNLEFLDMHGDPQACFS